MKLKRNCYPITIGAFTYEDMKRIRRARRMQIMAAFFWWCVFLIYASFLVFLIDLAVTG